MAMTAQVKAELANTSVTKSCCRKSEVSSTLRFAGGLHIVAGRIVVEAELDTGAAARRLRRDIMEVYGHPSEVVVISGGGLRRGTGVELGLHHDAAGDDVQPAGEPERGRDLGLPAARLGHRGVRELGFHLGRHRHGHDPATRRHESPMMSR